MSNSGSQTRLIKPQPDPGEGEHKIAALMQDVFESRWWRGLVTRRGGEVEEEEAKVASFTSWCKFLFTDVDKGRFWGRLRKHMPGVKRGWSWREVVLL